ncbi:MAG: hypothetical protein RL272_1248 [Candidatus Parcubacteria bacterium]|jgi:hypothetical protein
MMPSALESVGLRETPCTAVPAARTTGAGNHPPPDAGIGRERRGLPSAVVAPPGPADSAFSVAVPACHAGCRPPIDSDRGLFFQRQRPAGGFR